MPLKNGSLTPAERKIIDAMAGTGDKAYAQSVANVSQPAISRALSRPAVQAEIVRLQTERLFSEILPLAVSQHKALLEDPRTPAGAKVQAIKLAYDRAFGAQEGAQHKEPHEMTGDEIARAIAELERVASERAKPVLDVTANPSPGGLFD